MRLRARALHTVKYLRRRLLGLIGNGLIAPARHQAGAPGVNRDDALRILVARPNHRLGNQILTTPLLREIQETFPNAEVDLLLKGSHGTSVMKYQECVRSIIELPRHPLRNFRKYIRTLLGLRRTNYDLAINSESSSVTGLLAVRLCRARFRLRGLRDPESEPADPRLRHLAMAPVIRFRAWLRQTLDRSGDAVPGLEIRLSEAERMQGKHELARLVPGNGRVLCIYTFATGERCFNAAWWRRFHDAIRELLPDWSLVEALPVENISNLGFRIPAYYTRDIRQLAAFIAATDLFVSADCGVMHLAAASGTPTVGLFRVTSPERYAPYNAGCTGIDAAHRTPEDVARRVGEVAARHPRDDDGSGAAT